MASFGYYGTSQTSLVQTLVSPPKLGDDDDRSLTVPDELKVIPEEYLQKIQGILDCNRIPLDGRVTFLKRMVNDFTENPDRFFGQMGVMSVVQTQAFNQLFLNHIKKDYKYYSTNPNGSCGFEALMMPFQEKGWDVSHLRIAMGKFIRKNLEKLKLRDELDGGFKDVDEVKTEGKFNPVKLNDYIKKIETPAAISDGWLSIREIRIFVHCMHHANINVVVNVHSHFGWNDEFGSYAPDVYNKNLKGEEYEGDQDPIFVNLYWNGSGHYDYLDRIQAPAGDLVIAVDDDSKTDKNGTKTSSSSMLIDKEQGDSMVEIDDKKKKTSSSSSTDAQNMVIDMNDDSDSDQEMMTNQ